VQFAMGRAQLLLCAVALVASSCKFWSCKDGDCTQPSKCKVLSEGAAKSADAGARGFMVSCTG